MFETGKNRIPINATTNRQVFTKRNIRYTKCQVQAVLRVKIDCILSSDQKAAHVRLDMSDCHKVICPTVEN